MFTHTEQTGHIPIGLKSPENTYNWTKGIYYSSEDLHSLQNAQLCVIVFLLLAPFSDT